jgi:hypothetical protein
MEQIENRAVVLLTSGHVLKIAGVTLYPAEDLARVASLRVEAAAKLGGVSTGIGFIGSPGWALGASAALGLLEGAMSNAARREGFTILSKAEEMERETLTRGLFFRVGEISGIGRPSPAAWTAAAQTRRPAPLHHMGRRQRADFLAANGLTESDVSNGSILIPQTSPFAHDGDDFLTIDTDIGVMAIRWSSVVSYIGPPTSVPPPLSLRST